jgi:pyruvate,water dikinase
MLEDRFLQHFTQKSLKFARDSLDLARASYRLRDDDNVYLGRIEKAMADAVEEGKKRVIPEAKKNEPLETDEILRALRDETYTPQTMPSSAQTRVPHGVRVRQLRGQPASQGIATGKARVIEDMEDLFGFKAGEILVIDAVDPNTTFVIPLAAGIVERRGGMLIHGAIIAREYGIPCITGIPEATALIESGERITVDGFLGIVTVGK